MVFAKWVLYRGWTLRTISHIYSCFSQLWCSCWFVCTWYLAAFLSMPWCTFLPSPPFILARACYAPPTSPQLSIHTPGTSARRPGLFTCNLTSQLVLLHPLPPQVYTSLNPEQRLPYTHNGTVWRALLFWRGVVPSLCFELLNQGLLGLP